MNVSGLQGVCHVVRELSQKSQSWIELKERLNDHNANNLVPEKTCFKSN